MFKYNIFVGYCCLFLMSCYIGKLYHNLTASNRLQTVCRLFTLTFGMWGLFFIIVNKILPSRPLGNSTYILWGLANGTLHSFVYAVFDSVYPEKYRFIIFAEMISEYRLSIFILANLLSTVIRRIANIKSLSLLYTLKVVFSYLSVTCFIISIFFYKKQVKYYKKRSNYMIK